MYDNDFEPAQVEGRLQSESLPSFSQSETASKSVRMGVTEVQRASARDRRLCCDEGRTIGGVWGIGITSSESGTCTVACMLLGAGPEIPTLAGKRLAAT